MKTFNSQVEIDVSVKKTEGGEVWIRVSDNGIGFAPEVLQDKKPHKEGGSK